MKSDQVECVTYFKQLTQLMIEANETYLKHCQKQQDKHTEPYWTTQTITTLRIRFYQLRTHTNALSYYLMHVKDDALTDLHDECLKLVDKLRTILYEAMASKKHKV